MAIKKKIILGTGLVVTISAFLYLAIHFTSRHKGIIINEKTVMKMGRKAGFDVDNSANFGKQIQKKYEDLTPEQGQRVFYAILTAKWMPKVIKVFPPDLRKEAIDKTAEWLRKYRENMTEEEREKLRKKIKSSESQEMVHRAKYSYFEDFSAEERAEINPIVDGILKILSEL